MSLLVDDSSQASAPGRIKISPKKFLDYYHLGGIKGLYYRSLLRLPKEFLYRRFKGEEVITQWIYRSEQFQLGCINPSIILNKQKRLIATFTNLTNNGDIPTPVIKINKERLPLIKSTPLHNGQRLASVALYYQDEENPAATAWSDFEPNLPHCFTDDLTSCNEAMKEISHNGWRCLEEGLKQVPDVNREGLYYVDLDEELVNDAY